MKNRIFAAAAMFAAMTAVSCSKVAEVEEKPSYTYRFALVNEVLPAVRSDMTGDHLAFETGDWLGFSLEKDGNIVYTQRTSIQTTEPRPVFGFTTDIQMKAGDRICVVSPRVLPINNGNFNDLREPVNAGPMQSITIPLVQSHKGGKFDGTAMPMVSVPFTFTEDMLVGADNKIQSVKFLNLGALLDFRVFSTTGEYQGETVRDVIFEADKNIVGEFKINVQNVNPDDETTLAIDLASTRAEGDFATPLTNAARTESDAKVGTDKDNSGSVRMVVAPGTYAGKVKVRTDKAYYVFNLSAARTFDRNGIYPLGLDLAKATRVVMEAVDQTQWQCKFVNDDNPAGWRKVGNMIDGKLTTAWIQTYDKPIWDGKTDDLNYGSSCDDFVSMNMEWHRDIPNIVFVFDFKKDVEVGRVGIGKLPESWPYNHDLRNCEFYIGATWSFKSAGTNADYPYWTGGGTLENYNTANDGNDWKLVLTATDIPKENGLFWYDVPETVGKADRTGRYLKIRPTAGYRGNTPCEIAEIYVDGIVTGNTAEVE